MGSRTLLLGALLPTLALVLGGCDETAPQVETTDPAGPGGKADEVDSGDPDPAEPVSFYPTGTVHSPLSTDVVNNIRSIVASGNGADDVFMSVGDSITVGSGNLRCFGGSNVDLGDHEALATTLEFFRNGDAAGSNPFSRDPLSARVGKTAKWALSGSPSPVEAELNALNPSIALVQYGTNDMQFGSTFASALPGFYTSLGDLLDVIVDDGVVPVLFTIPPRLDSEGARDWVPMYNLAIRGLAQSRALPLVDLNMTLEDIPGHGLVSDGIHLGSAPSGACDLSEDGLRHAYNNRNAAALTALDRVTGALSDGEPLDAPTLRPGQGTASSPFAIESLPFVDSGDTDVRGSTDVDRYDCSSSDEGGAEIWYRLELTERTSIRAMIVDAPQTDVDLHIVGEALDGSGCIARHDRLLEVTLDAGVHHIAVDTFVSSGVPRSGEYLLMLTEM